MTNRFKFAQPAGRRAWVRELLAPFNEAKWSELCWELFAAQYARVSAIRNLCHGRGTPPQAFRSWKEIPRRAAGTL